MEHLIPLMVVAGAAGSDPGRSSFRDLIGEKAYSCSSSPGAAAGHSNGMVRANTDQGAR
jgi:hypothetical protein